MMYLKFACDICSGSECRKLRSSEQPQTRTTGMPDTTFDFAFSYELDCLTCRLRIIAELYKFEGYIPMAKVGSNYSPDST